MVVNLVFDVVGGLGIFPFVFLLLGNFPPFVAKKTDTSERQRNVATKEGEECS